MADETQDRKTRIQKLTTWAIPIVAVLLTVAAGLFIRALIDPEIDNQTIHYGTKPFVPAESPYSTGPDSR